jgi:hypothetical protein
MLLVYGFCAAVNGLDRMSGVYPDAPGVLGWLFDANSATDRSREALNHNQFDLSWQLAAHALPKDPINPAILGQMGTAKLLANRPDSAQRIFGVSAQMGWRDISTQIFWLDQALRVGDATVAAQRMDAVLRQTLPSDQTDQLISTMLGTVEGRGAIAARLREKPNWAADFVADADSLSAQDLDGRIAVVLQTGGAVWGCDGIADFVDKVVAAGRVADAKTIWGQICGGGNRLLFDGAFRRLDMTKSRRAFDWRVASRGDSELQIDVSDSAGPSLRIVSHAAAATVMIRQWVVLPPGAYRLSWTMPNTNVRDSGALRAGLDCPGETTLPVAGRRAGGQSDKRLVADFFVDGRCPLQEIKFWLSPGSQISIADVRLVGVSR